MNVLVVDDSRPMRLLIMRALRTAGITTMKVFEAGGGAEALAEFERRRFHLVLTDLHMAEMNGIQLVRQLHRMNPQVPCGMVTSETDPVLLEDAVEAGASFIVTKPFEPEELTRMVKRYSKGG